MKQHDVQNPLKKLLTEAKLAEILGVSQWTVRRWRLAEGLPVCRIGGRYLYKMDAVNAWLDSFETNGAEETKSEEVGVIRPVR